ncbi:E3 ubiquitin-protein ligase ZSWIM2-like [Sarcophilus harrisii]
MPRGLGGGRGNGGGGWSSERRRCVTDCLKRHQDQALSSHMYLLRETGPTGFLMSENEPDGSNYRVTAVPGQERILPLPPPPKEVLSLGVGTPQ